jgi:hypothetical protein
MDKTQINQYWSDIIEDFKSSGLNQKDYAAKNNLKLYTLGYYLRKHQTSFNGFIEVTDTTNNSLPSSSPIEISINKTKILIKDDYDEELLLKVLRTVKNI